MTFFTPSKGICLSDYVSYSNVIDYLGFIGSTFSISDVLNEQGGEEVVFRVGRNSKNFTRYLFKSLNLDETPCLIISDFSEDIKKDSFFYKKSFLDTLDLSSFMLNDQIISFTFSNQKIKYYKTFKSLIIDRYEDYSENIFLQNNEILYLPYRKKHRLIKEFHYEEYKSLKKGQKKRWFDDLYKKDKVPKEKVFSDLLNKYQNNEVSVIR